MIQPKHPSALVGPGSRAVIAAVTRPIDRHMLPSIDDTLVGITHYADRWERDVDGTLVLVCEPRGARVDGGAVDTPDAYRRSMGGGR